MCKLTLLVLCVIMSPDFRSPGFGLTLVSETTSGMMHAAESSTYSLSGTSSSSDKGSTEKDKEPLLPEDVGRHAASLLIQEIVKVRCGLKEVFLVMSKFTQGGCVDHCCQVIPVLFMALGQKDVSKVLLGELSDYTYV